MHDPASVKALLEKALGRTFDDELRSAWAATYDSLVAITEAGTSDATPATSVCFA